MITIVHTGQAGVERGADRAARSMGYDVRGFCQRDKRDEWGALPAVIAGDLTAVECRGVRLVWPPTLAIADILVIAVPDARAVKANPGLGALQTLTRARGIPQIVIDPRTDLDELARDLRRRELAKGRLNIMICGPRATRWHAGERLGWQIVMSLAAVRDAMSRRVLIVDDHPDTVRTMCHLVTSMGHEVATASTVGEALVCADVLHPDVGLFDIGLPDASGYELARKIRASQTQPMFLAAITGLDQARDSTAAMNAGFDQHVIKPIGAELIRRVLDSAGARLRAV